MAKRPKPSTDKPTTRRNEPAPGLGLRLREIRRQRGWTLAQLSKCTGLAISTLSKVENNRLSLTYDKIVQLSRGLSLDISEVVGGTMQPRTPRTRKAYQAPGEGSRIDTGPYEYAYLCTDILDKAMIPMIGDIRATSVAEFSGWIRHPGEEYTYVLEGEIDFHSEHYETVRLEAGASIYFDATMGHLYIRASTARARILCVCTEPVREAALLSKTTTRRKHPSPQPNDTSPDSPSAHGTGAIPSEAAPARRRGAAIADGGDGNARAMPAAKRRR